MITDTLLDCAHRAVEICQQGIREGLAPAVVVFDNGDEFIEQNYWDPDVGQKWERIVAVRGKQTSVTSGAFATSLYATHDPEKMGGRPPDPDDPPRPGEVEEMFIFMFSTEEPFDIGRVQMERQKGLQVEFGDLEILNGDSRLADDTPGFTLLRWLLDQ